MTTSVIFACGNEEKDEADKLIADVRWHYERANRLFIEMITKLERGEAPELGDPKKIIGMLEHASGMALQARQKLDERNKKQRGIAHDYAIDFDAARSEIGRRLACLRSAGGTGEFPE